MRQDVVCDVKRVINDLVLSELKDSCIDVDVWALTFFEYYSNFIFKQNKKTCYSFLPFTSVAFNDLGGNIVIFVDYFSKIKDDEERYYKLLKIFYHELRHSMQLDFDCYGYDRFLIDMDEILQRFQLFSFRDYFIFHDKYSFEIGANMYGSYMAREYLKKNCYNLYLNKKFFIDKDFNKYLYDYYTYDACCTFSNFVKVIRDCRVNDFLDINPNFGYFLNDDYSFKSFNEIICNEKFNTIDKRIVACVFSSEIFMKELNIKRLSYEEVSVLDMYLKYMNNVYDNQSKIIKKHNKRIL